MKKLLENKDNFAVVFKLSPVAMLILDEDYLIFAANDEALEILNKREEDLVGKVIGDGIGCIGSTEDMRGCGFGDSCIICELRDGVSQVLYGQANSLSMEKLIKQVDGDKKVEMWYKVNIMPVTLYDKVKIIVTLIDITSTKQKELEALKNTRFYQHMLNFLPNPVWSINAEGACDYFNESWLRFTGIDFNEALKQGWIGAIHPEDIDRIIQESSKSFLDLAEIRVEGRFRRYDGKYRICRSIGMPRYSLEGKFLGYIGTLYDITEQKHYEEDLKKAGEYYLKILESFPTPIWRNDKNGKSVFINKSWSKFTGQPANADFNLGWLNSIHPEDQKLCLDIHKQSYHTKEPFQLEYRMLNNAGEYRWVLGIHEPFYSAEGEFDGYIGMSLDIHESKRVEEILHRYQLIFQNARDIILFVDLDGRIVEANNAATKAYGYSLDELLEMNIGKLKPDGKQIKELLAASYEQGAFFDTVHFRKDGSTFPAEVSSQGVNIGGRKMLISVIRDTSERLEAEQALRISEEKFRHLFDNAKDAMFLHEVNEDGSDSIFIEVNDAACSRLGYTRDELVGASPEKISDPPYGGTYMQRLSSTIAWKHINIETTHLAKDGTQIPVEVNSHCFELHGKLHIISVARDITERKATEERLKAAVQEAKAANKAKSEFLANMSHEIRTPLNGMLGMIDLTMFTELTSEQKENLSTAKQCADSLLNIINDILDFSKMEAGKLSFQNTSFNVRNLIEETIKIHSIKAMNKGLELSYRLGASIPQYLFGDPHRLQQVINNLVSNAIKFTDRGEIVLNVKKNSKAGDKLELLFSVSDTGAGINKNDIDKLFRSFSQLNGTMTRKYGGTGLGLAISKQLVEMMHGRICVESEKGKGSTFYFTACLDVGQAIPDQQKAIVKPSVDTKYLKLLLAEDDSINQRVLMKLLKERGYMVELASNGQEAIAMYICKKYDAILMDIQMPEVDGIEATRMIREIEKKYNIHTPIIALTAFALQGDRERFLSLGMDDYVAKPIKLEELYEKLDSITSISSRPSLIEGVTLKSNGELMFVEKNKLQLDDKVESLIKQISDSITELELAVDNKDGSMIEKLSHRIKELADSIDAYEIKSSAFRVELAARRSDIEGTLLSTMQLRHEFETLRKSTN